MTKLLHIGEYIVNPANIAYMEIWEKDGMSHGTTINFNAYAAVAGPSGDTAWEPMSIQIFGLAPAQVMDFINNEPPF